jgi:hypothetical protein
VNVSNEPRGHVRKKSVRKKRSDPPVFKSETVARIERQINDRWPNLGRRLASLIRVSREKIDDLYSSAAQAISEHKEAFEDRLAEKKAQAREASRRAQQRPTPARPVRRAPGGVVKNGTVKSSIAPLPSKRTRSSTKRS